MNTPNSQRSNMKQLVAAVSRGEGEDEKTFWTRVGVAFENRDGSWNLKFDFLPTDPRTTLQLREMDRRHDEESPDSRPAASEPNAA